MNQSVGRIFQLRLYPIRPLWSFGSGWAAIGGGLAVGGLALSTQAWLGLLLAWFLADPLLGMVWDMGAGNARSGLQRGIWQRLLKPDLSETIAAWRWLPYTQVNSPGYRLARYLGRIYHWWQAQFWPEVGREFSTLVAALGLALLLGGILGRNLLALVLFSIALSWLAALARARQAAGDTAPLPHAHQSVVRLWHTLGEFAVPWIMGAMLVGKPSWPIILVGICYAITYFGLLGHPLDFWWVGAGQAVAALLLAGLRYPLTAGAMAILLMPQWGLHAWAATLWAERAEGFGAYLQAVQPLVILGMLMAALTVAS